MMRINLNLGLFFHDHRSLAKICVKKHKYIKDVEKHISDVFDIHNFYLKCENHYLPSSENIEVLSNDDFLWVIPLGESTEHYISSTRNVPPEPNDLEREQHEKKKKKKRCLEHNEVSGPSKKKKYKSSKKILEEDPEIIEVEESPIRKKTKKRKGDANDKNDEGRESNAVDENESGTRNPETNRSKVTPPTNAVSPKDSGRDSFDDASNDSKIVNVKSLVSSFEKQGDFGKQLIMNLNNDSRKVNIVKTIIISNKTNSITSSAEKSFDGIKPEDGSTPVNNSLIQNENKDSSDILNTTFRRSELSLQYDAIKSTHRTESTLSDILKTNSISTDETLSSVSYSTLSEVDANVNKRKRRRSHRRKRLLNKGAINASVGRVQELTPYKPVVTLAPVHVRFSDTIEQMDGKTVETQAATLNNDLEVINEPENINNQNSLIEHINLDNVSDNLKNIHLEKYILKQPVTKDLVPKVGEVIAFKILKLSENYSPEVSSDIVGKVLSYTDDSKEVMFEVVYGWDQCSDPLGKFALDQNASSEDGSRKFQCVWSNLLEPKIIFP